MFDRLFEPIKIGPMTIKNRVAMAPMNQQGDRDAHVTRQYTSFFTARALGGFSLLTTGSILTNKSTKEEYPFVPYLFPGSFNMGYWTDFTEAIHSMGVDAKIFAQLSPGFGRQTGVKGAKGASAIPFSREHLYAGLTERARTWAKYWRNDWANHLLGTPREMTVEEIKSDTKSFVRSAELAVMAGFDGIEVHAPHGYLLHQFLSPRSNQRTDEYGGSVRNRARYVIEIVQMTRKHFGSAIPIVVRMSGREYQDGGIQPEDVREVAKMCEDAGADAISLSNGSGYDDLRHFMPDTPDNEDLLEAQGRKLKAVIRIPVITVGFTDPARAERAVIEGDTDMVALGRQAMADPEWPNKAIDGKADEIVKCTRCLYCTHMGINAGTVAMKCTANPNYGKEEFNPAYWPKPMKGKLPETLRRWKPGDRWQASGPWHDFFASK
jgi:2,4-dienoyl-CoA reductase-like NADH-dependent reductase (Old Yellow Enzyme family)